MTVRAGRALKRLCQEFRICGVGNVQIKVSGAAP
jgi:hypothetical protein